MSTGNPQGAHDHGFEVGQQGRVSHTVTEDDTAVAQGSGDVPAFATPRLLALAEAATLVAIAGSLDSGDSTVGTRVDVEHLAPLAIGSDVEVLATLERVDGRLLRFEFAAADDTGRLIGHGHVTRVVVNRKRFLDRL